MYSMFPKDTFCRSSLKSAIFPLAQVHSILPVPMVEILKRGRDHWRSVLEQQLRQPNLVMLFALMHVRLLFPSLHGAFLRIKNQSFVELYPSLWLLLIRERCPGSSHPPPSIYISLSLCIGQASVGVSVMLVIRWLSDSSDDYWSWSVRCWVLGGMLVSAREVMLPERRCMSRHIVIRQARRRVDVKTMVVTFPVY